MWNPFSNKWFYDEGTEWIGKGRWIMPVPGDPNRKKTNTRLITICICIIVVALLGLSIWLGIPDYTYKKLPNFDILYDMIGRSAADVAPVARANPEDLLASSDGTYKMAEVEKYAGIAFETTLYFEDEKLSGFAYTYSAPADTKEAAKVISNVAEMFTIEDLITSQKTRVDMNEVLVRRYLDQFAESNQEFLVEDVIDWTPEEHAYQNAVATYLRMLENDPDWEGRVGEYLVREARFYRQIHMNYQPDTQTVSVQIRFYVDIEPEKW